MDRVIVTRHPAAVRFLARHLGGTVMASTAGEDGDFGSFSIEHGFVSVLAADGEVIPVLSDAFPTDVDGKIVYGNLPLPLASLAAVVHVIEFTGAPPCGREHGLEEMDAAGASLAAYRVTRV